MNNLHFLFNLTICLILSTAFQQQVYQDNDKNQPPNIIFILADDLGYGDLGSFGQEDIHTPNLDRMAHEGMRFTQHYAGSTVCAPSRSVLMTGLHTGHTPIRGNKEILPIGQYPLQYGTVTLPKVLQDAGYATGGFGKWGLGYPESEGMPSYQGFDEFFGYLGQRRAHFYYPEFLFRDLKDQLLQRVYLEGNKVRDNPERHPGSGQAIRAEKYSADVINEEALTFIEKNKEGPFFLYLPSLIPHAELAVPNEDLELYLDENGESIFLEEPFEGNHYTAQPMPRAVYAAMVTRLDRHVGQVMDKVKAEGIAENTLMIFTSDNGSHNAGGYHYSMHNSNGPLRGGKRDLYEGGIRVPMIAWWPGKVEAGSTSNHISYFADMLPTFSEMANAYTPPGIDGISMVPTLVGIEEQQEHEYLYWEFHEQGGKQAVRKGNWKAVRLNVFEDPEAPVELYNLDEDIQESNNVADQHPDIINQMDHLMKEAHVPSEVFRLNIK